MDTALEEVVTMIMQEITILEVKRKCLKKMSFLLSN